MGVRQLFSGGDGRRVSDPRKLLRLIVFEDIFKTIYEFWRDYRPAAGLLRDTGRRLRERIQVVTEHGEYQLITCEDHFWSGCQGCGSGADG